MITYKILIRHILLSTQSLLCTKTSLHDACTSIYYLSLKHIITFIKFKSKIFSFVQIQLLNLHIFCLIIDMITAHCQGPFLKFLSWLQLITFFVPFMIILLFDYNTRHVPKLFLMVSLWKKSKKDRKKLKNGIRWFILIKKTYNYF